MPVRDDGKNLVPGGGGGTPVGQAADPVPTAHTFAPKFEVELPGGGKLRLQSHEEVELWEESRDRYINDYGIAQQNDLILIGSILTQQLILFRAQGRASGMEPEFDQHGHPTGQYKRINVKAADLTGAQKIITACAEEIRKAEQALGIDKKTREAGGTQTVAAYVGTLKEAAREYGLHIARRVKEYERVCMEARWKLRLLRNGDDEDKAYHDISPEKILSWLEKELADLEAMDKKHAREVGKLYLGKMR